MELQLAIKNRRTIHSFNTLEVPESIIKRAIEAANYAPCHRLTFPWRFTNVKRVEREMLASLQLDLKFPKQVIKEAVKEKIKVKILNPSHLIVASQVITNGQERKLEDYAACACAIQNFMLSLTGDGIGSKWSTGKLTTEAKTYEIIGINPHEEEIIGFIWVGHGEIPISIKRPLVTSIFREK